mmetsp:Transcript_131362/g.227487  ORF Transcript_131362/g.227487 Transcript_131362/m.227487 type:complete len:171 (+) Transcript_131362:85-597(+)
MAAPDEGLEEIEGADIFYVCKSALQEVKEKLKKGEDIDQALVNKLTFPDDLPDEEVMCPVDMRGIGQEFNDVEQMVEKLGAKGTAEAFVKAGDYFEANKDKEPEEDQPKEMSAAEWRKVLEEEEDEFAEGEEEDFFEGEEEEEFLEEGEEEPPEEAVEPPPKKAKVVNTD